MNTVRVALPAIAISGAVTTAVNWFAEMKVVCRSVLFQRTIDELLKFAPESVTTKFGPPASAEVGSTLLRVGTGLVGGLMLKGAEFDVTTDNPAFRTVTSTVPGTARSVAGIAADNWLREMKVVGRLAPSHLTIEVVLKSEPSTINVNAGPPVVAEVGLKLVIDGVLVWPNVSSAVLQKSIRAESAIILLIFGISANMNFVSLLHK